eukprot:7381797-Prymnesium_polylepis.1
MATCERGEVVGPRGGVTWWGHVVGSCSPVCRWPPAREVAGVARGKITWVGGHMAGSTRCGHMARGHMARPPGGVHTVRSHGAGSRGAEVTWRGGHVARGSRGAGVTWRGGHMARRSRGA